MRSRDSADNGKNRKGDVTVKTLTLSLKRKWFDMIKAGVKKEEYREIGMFWSVRFLGVTIAKKFNLVDYKFVDAQNIREDLNAI